MTAGVYDITIEQGATFPFVVAVQDENGAPRPLTGYTAKMQVRPTVDSSTKILDLSTGGSGIVIDEPNGTITITVTATATALLNFTTAVYDLEITSGATVERILEGNVTLSKEVTR